MNCLKTLASKNDLDFCGVYRIRNILNGKIYIGSTGRSFRQRIAEHACRLQFGDHHCPHLQSAWDKYGKECFVFEVVEICEPKHASAQEQVFVDSWKVCDRRFGYNARIEVTSSIGVKRSEESRKKMSVSQLRRAKNPEVIAAMSLKQKKYFVDNPEKRESLSIKAKEQFATEESRIHHSWKCKAGWTDAARKAQSERRKKYFENPENRKKQSERTKLRMAIPEARKKQSDSMRLIQKDPEVRAKRSLVMKKMCEDPKRLEEMSIRSKLQWADPVKRAEMMAKRMETKARNKASKEN